MVLLHKKKGQALSIDLEAISIKVLAETLDMNEIVLWFE